MSTASRDITKAIKALSGFDDLQFESVACNVIDVDTTNMTCDCAPINGDADFLDVRLNADYTKGFTLIPKKNSVVIVSQLSDATAYVAMYSDVDQIYLAGDSNGGLVNVNILSTALNTLQTEINTLKTTIGANLTAMGVALVAVDGGVTTAQAGVLNGVVLPQINISQIENKKVLHGNG
jgi:hypothetical protein